jgi:S1-C subfamily serine protease
MEPMEKKPGPDLQPRRAALEHLTGPSCGTVTWLDGSNVEISLSPDRFIRACAARPSEPGDEIVAQLRSAENTFEIDAGEGRPIWVNGARVTSRLLENCDIVEFGETGPVSRFVQDREGQPARRTVAEILSDVLACLRVSRRPIVMRLCSAFGQLLRRVTRETTILFRVGVILAIAALATLAYQQNRLNILLQQQIESSALQLEGFANALTRAREQSLAPSDLENLRQELTHGLSSSEDRLAALERRTQASATVIAAAMSSVVFLQGAYGFREESSDRMLRHTVDGEGRPLFSPMGQPLLSLEGDGPVAERQFTGSAFAVGEHGVLVTNRHLALPWEYDSNSEVLADPGFVPVMTRFIVYVPGGAEAGVVETIMVSEDADLAILRQVDEGPRFTGLTLADAAPTAGDEVIVMGYPTGLRSMLAQAGDAFIEELQTTENTGFWSVAARLAEEGHIMPLASRGIVGHVTPVTIVYDADTTHGGSGGPVFDIHGSVVAVNAAILPEYGGSNLGVPIAKLRALLEGAELR